MITNTNISKRVYQVVGFEGTEPFKEIFVLSKLMSNSDEDTELLYTLQEYIDEILDLRVGETFISRVSRDSDMISAILIRVN